MDASLSTGADDSSVGTNGSQEISTVQSNNDDNSTVSTRRTAKQMKSTAKLIKNKKFQTTTTLIFIGLDGERVSKELAFRVTNYSELQREIARLYPASRKMFVVQDADGQKIFPENFVPATKMYIREILTKPPNIQMLRTFDTRWETEDYHDIKFRNQAISLESRYMK